MPLGSVVLRRLTCSRSCKLVLLSLFGAPHTLLSLLSCYCTSAGALPLLLASPGFFARFGNSNRECHAVLAAFGRANTCILVSL